MRFIAFLVAALASLSAAAQDVPSRVGRVSYIQGSVAIYQDPDIGWEKAYVNSPVTSENSLWTEPGSHAEVRVSAVALRLDRYESRRLSDILFQLFRIAYYLYGFTRRLDQSLTNLKRWFSRFIGS